MEMNDAEWICLVGGHTQRLEDTFGEPFMSQYR